MNNRNVQLGDRVEDVVSGFVGIATSRSEFLNGCVRFGVTSRAKDAYSGYDVRYIDVEQLLVVQAGACERRPGRPAGGDRPDVQRHEGPSHAGILA